jgi:hypothetical protein
VDLVPSTDPASDGPRKSLIDDLLLAEADDVRRLSLDAIDANARALGTWGTKEHRSERATVDRAYDEAALALGRLSEQQRDDLVKVRLVEPPSPDPGRSQGA